VKSYREGVDDVDDAKFLEAEEADQDDSEEDVPVRGNKRRLTEARRRVVSDHSLFF
jgi:hypothetical protein